MQAKTIKFDYYGQAAIIGQNVDHTAAYLVFYDKFGSTTLVLSPYDAEKLAKEILNKAMEIRHAHNAQKREN